MDQWDLYADLDFFFTRFEVPEQNMNTYFCCYFWQKYTDEINEIFFYLTWSL